MRKQKNNDDLLQHDRMGITATKTMTKLKPCIKRAMSFAAASGGTIQKVKGVYKYTDKVTLTTHDLAVKRWRTIYHHEAAEAIRFYHYLNMTLTNLIKYLKAELPLLSVNLPDSN